MGSKDLDRMLKNYKEIYGRPTPIRYDVLRFSEEHRRLDALLRRYYDYLHPLVKDLFTSFALEFQYLIEVSDKLKEENERIVDEYEKKRADLENLREEKFKELKEELSKLRDEVAKNKEEREKLDEQISRLSQMVKEKDAIINTQRQQLDTLMKETSYLASEDEQKKEIIMQSINTVAQISEQLTTIEQEMRALELENTRLTEENNQLKYELQKKSDEFRNEIMQITSSYQKLKKHLEKVESVLLKGKKERQDLLSNIDRLEGMYNKKKREADEYHEERDLLANRIVELEKELEEKEAEIAALREKNESYSGIAKRLLQLKEKVNLDQEVPGTREQKKHPATKTQRKVRKWTPKGKTALEYELELESGTATRADLNRLSIYRDKSKSDTNIGELLKHMEDGDEQQRGIMETIRTVKPIQVPLSNPIPQTPHTRATEVLDAQDTNPNENDTQETDSPAQTIDNDVHQGEDLPLPPRTQPKKTKEKESDKGMLSLS